MNKASKFVETRNAILTDSMRPQFLVGEIVVAKVNDGGYVELCAAYLTQESAWDLMEWLRETLQDPVAKQMTSGSTA